MNASNRINCWLRSSGAPALALLALLSASCSHEAADTHSDTVVVADQGSASTDREARESLAGEMAPGRHTYTYRGLYAGITRTRLESRVARAQGGTPPCALSTSKPPELVCHYQLLPDADGATVSLDVTYAGSGDDMTARVISAVRELPIDVDGPALAHVLADAFEKQTVLLDKRDATYGHHSAQVRMGTVNGARQNFVDVLVQTKEGREIMTVTLSRGSRPAPGAAAH